VAASTNDPPRPPGPRRGPPGPLAVALGLGGAALAGRLVRSLAGDGPQALPGWVAALFGTDEASLQAPAWLGLLPFAALPWLLASGSLAGLPGWQRRLATGLRSLLVALVVLALAQPVVLREVRRLSTVFVVDVSDSVGEPAIERAGALVGEAWRARGEDDVELVTFAGAASRVAPIDGAPPVPRRRDEAPPRTRLERAVQLATSLFPPGHLRRLVVISDGIETEGDVLTLAPRLTEAGVRVFAVPITDAPAREVAVTGIDVEGSPRVGQPFTLHVGLFATAPARVRVRVYRDGLLEPSLGVPELALDAGARDVAVRSVAHVPGPVAFRAEVEVLGEADDRHAENNAYATSVTVEGRPAVLYVEGTAASASYLARALEASELDVEVRSPRAMPTTAGELARFQMVVLSDTAAEDVPSAAMDALARWVRAGGGFLMAGGERSFGLGGWQGTPVAEILPVRLDGERRRDDASIAIALVLDKSGSMEGEKLELAKEAARATVELLGPADSIGVIGFDGAPDRVVRMQSAGNRLAIARDIGRLAAGGGTAIFPALDAAFSDLSAVRARFRHVILLTDGNTDESGLPTLAAAMRASGITVSTVGIGADVNRSLLSEIADVGGGRSHFTADPHHIPRIFVRETTEAMRSSVVEDYFLPQVERPADFLRGVGIEDAPWLRGFVATRARGAPAEVLLTTETGEPLLARWRVGLGWSLAWTSDVKNRWAADWVRWPGYAPFFGGLVRAHLRRRAESELPLRAEVEGDEARLVVDALDDEDRFIDDLESLARITPEGGGEPFELPLSMVAPGRYEARTPLPGFGAYAVAVEHRRGGTLVARSTGRIDHPYPEELADFTPRPERLAALAERTGGGAYSSPDDLRPQSGEQVTAEASLRAPVFFAALALFCAELLLRRVRFGG